MDIKYLGHASFFIRSKDAKLVTDPFDPKVVGLKYPKAEADIVTMSHLHDDHNYAAGVSPDALVIDMPGEFEKNSVRVTGFASYHDAKKGAERGENTLYKIDADGISVLHCGDMGVVPDESFIEQIGEVDVLMVPVGGSFTIDSDEAVQVVKKIEPSIVIPMHYRVEGMSPDIASKLAPVTDFLKKMGAEEVEPVSKLTIKKEDLQSGMKVILMSV